MLAVGFWTAFNGSDSFFMENGVIILINIHKFI